MRKLSVTESTKSIENYPSLEKDVVFNTLTQIIKDLPPKAINELFSAYRDDADRLIRSMSKQALRSYGCGETLDFENMQYVETVRDSVDETLKILSYNYFKTTVLSNFRQGWRNLEWGNLIQLFPYICILASRSHGKSFEMCYAFPLWRLYSYSRPTSFTADSVDNKNRQETCLITNTALLGKNHITKIREEIQLNPILERKLNPTGKASLAETSIVTETGSKIYMRGKDGFIRGLHVGAAVCDDMPDESSIYSAEQRQKISQLFRGTIMPIVEPYGYLIVSGTPFHQQDLYSELKGDPRFKVFEYPAIFPDGRLLAPDRFTFKDLAEEKTSLGSLEFSREYLVVPISENTSIFPYDILMRSTLGMESFSFSETIERYPIKLKRVVVGCDFAISGSIGADYSVFSVWGSDWNDNYYLIYLFRGKGLSANEQISQIVNLDRRYKPNVIVVENNGFQTIMGDLARQSGLRNIQPFNTTSSIKKNLITGLPSLAALFERGSLRIPYAQGSTRDTANLLFSEFNSISFREDKGSLEASSGHDDCCMSAFMAINELRENNIAIKIDFV